MKKYLLEKVNYSIKDLLQQNIFFFYPVRTLTEPMDFLSPTLYIYILVIQLDILRPHTYLL